MSADVNFMLLDSRDTLYVAGQVRSSSSDRQHVTELLCETLDAIHRTWNPNERGDGRASLLPQESN